MSAVVADLGGTHARFAVVGVSDDGLELVTRRTYASADFQDALSALRRFVADVGVRPSSVSVAMAGPVRNGTGSMTNLDWELSEADLVEATGAEDATLLNDFEALGHAVSHLGDGDLTELRAAERDARGVVGLLGAGTGLGASYVIPRCGRPAEVRASEAGHGDFAPRTDDEWALRAFLAERHSHVSWEHVLSAGGLLAIYHYLIATGRETADADTSAALAASDPSRVVSRRGLDRSDAACARALEIFGAVYGAKTGDLALELGATGGVYLAGGIAPGILPALHDEGFHDAFTGKGRMRPWLERIPLHVITRGSAGLIGAAAALQITTP